MKSLRCMLGFHYPLEKARWLRHMKIPARTEGFIGLECDRCGQRSIDHVGVHPPSPIYRPDDIRKDRVYEAARLWMTGEDVTGFLEVV